MKVCPFCEQGIVHKAMIKKTGTRIYICDECDATWQIGCEIRSDSFEGFDVLMKRLGGKGLWSELTELDKDWNK